MIVENFEEQHLMKLNEAVSYVRLRFVIGVIDLLWLYVVELRRASPGNTFKLNINRHGSGLQPRFGRCYMCFDGTKKALTLTCRPFIGLDEFH